MDDIPINQDCPNKLIVVTAGSTYLDIDAYACCVALAELINLKGGKAIAYSKASCNYSVCESLITGEAVVNFLSTDFHRGNTQYIIVDVSDPEYIRGEVPLDDVIAVYDHHTGFEDYWTDRIGENSHIEFIGAAATLIYHEWKEAGLQKQMKRNTALLLIAAILDNTLNLTSSNTTPDDIEAFHALCEKADVDEDWYVSYFSEVQSSVEADLKNAMLGDMKTNGNLKILPATIAQLCVWDADKIMKKLEEIRPWFVDIDSWMINIIDIKHNCSYFICDDTYHQEQIEKVFGFNFNKGVAKSSIPYLRKEIIKKTQLYE